MRANIRGIAVLFSFQSGLDFSGTAVEPKVAAERDTQISVFATIWSEARSAIPFGMMTVAQGGIQRQQ